MTPASRRRFEPLETERLLLRPVEAGDVDALHRRRSDPTTAEFQAWDVPYPPDRARELVDSMVELDGVVPAEGWFQLSIVDRERGVVVGDVALHTTFDARCVELGWSLEAATRGRGVATEAVDAVARWCVEQLGVSRLSAAMHPDNRASARVAERVGMVFEGVAEKAFWLDRYDGTAENSDDLRYAMTDDQWRAWQRRRRTSPTVVTLVPLEPGNARSMLALRTHRSQEHLVAPMEESMADAATHLLDEGTVVPWLRGVEADGELVGFVMVAEPRTGRPEAYLWRLLIDRMHQRRGVGRRVLDAVADQARTWQAPAVTVSWVPGPGSPEPFYRSYGFEPTGEIHDGEVVARLPL